MTTFIVVSEIASNHFGDIELAKKYIEKSKEAGADAVKLQYFNVDDGFFPEDDPRFETVKRAQLSLEQLSELLNHCERVGIGFLCTPFFRVERVEELATLDLHKVKIREKDSKNEAMIKRSLELFDEVLISTTKIPLDPFLLWNPHIRWLLTIPRYPAKMEELELDRIVSFDGYSNHIPNIIAPLVVASVAKALGKESFAIEVHVTLSHDEPVLDRAVSIDFSELGQLVGWLREIEKINTRKSNKKRS
ncbi:MAG: N-acetylneuraminate synthase family protein [Desulfobacterales bacterium]|nr:N-acetylneuraminate synthase family protein [Desulfobacterales bacterium]